VRFNPVALAGPYVLLMCLSMSVMASCMLTFFAAQVSEVVTRTASSTDACSLRMTHSSMLSVGCIRAYAC
jgi:hypothetical protein